MGDFPRMVCHFRRAILTVLLGSVCCGTALGVFAIAQAEEGASAPQAEPPLDEAALRHWAFRPLAPFETLTVKDAAWPRSSIDRFILAKQESHELQPLPEANRAALLRRVTLDLTGLPPTIDEQIAWERDEQPDAYERLVDRLLASPAFGVHAAQRWLDLARYADTDGFEHDHERPHAWRYRDWVINALNRDEPYASFLSRQIAGDLLDPHSTDAVIATGFLLCGPDMPDLNLQDERRHRVLNDMTAAVGAIALGLQFGCAECHDHKADPLSIRDFYRLRAFFDGLEIFKDQPLPNSDVVARVVREGPGRESRVMVRGDFRRPGERVEPQFPRIANVPLAGEPRSLPLDPARPSRAQLALWLTEPLPPLAARTIVNRIWQDHFGRALSSLPSDLGMMGESPSHPELLDWLAAEWPLRSGSLKSLRRDLVTSATYRQASSWSISRGPMPQPRAALTSQQRARRLDPTNRWLVGMPRRRLEAEVIRDSLLAVSDQLNHALGGPGIRPPLPDELASTLLKNQWTVTPREAEHTRRSVYLFVRRNLREPTLDVFDRPDPNGSCPTRHVSTTAPQALNLMNSQLTIGAARRLVDEGTRKGNDGATRTDWLVRTLWGRSATADDRQLVEGFLRDASSQGQAVADAWLDIARAMINASEFVYVD